MFGVPAAHEDDPERAVRAAFAFGQRVHGDESALFDIRIGIASGEVVTGGGEDEEMAALRRATETSLPA